MEQMDLIIIAFCSLVAVIGLLFVVLQKKGKIHPVLTVTPNGFNFTSGGTIVLLGAILGAVMIHKYSVPWMIFYLVIIAGIYALIQVIYRK
ncbi:hypothetical protein ACQRBN_09795 [Bariatricus sp. SGI.154]|uniref:hypothetical protein n=1 Tax=Bariatricus sp. SGI.154 TaxID=3420549 RepID=UPI003D033147